MTVVMFFKKAMNPTNKLVSDLVSMESCYINTGHPDFLNGNRVSISLRLDMGMYTNVAGGKAMAIVHERHNAAKPVQVDPKTGKPLPSGRDSPNPQAVGIESENTGFFSTFFASKNKKKMAAMEAPPPTLRASGTLSEREGQEVEVISESPCDQSPCNLSNVLSRTVDPIVLQHRKANDDRYGAESYHAQPCTVSI
jgi:dynamin 1-like protein